MSANNSESTIPAQELCDPCRWPVKNGATQKNEPCGWREGVSLRYHLKSHKFKGKPLTVAQYLKRFPRANLGFTYKPPQEHVDKLVAKAIAKAGGTEVEAPQKPESPQTQAYTPDEAKIQERIATLQRMVNFDPSAIQFCEQAAREEDRLGQMNRKLDELMAANADYGAMKWLRQAISDSAELLQNIFKHLDLTVAQRRKQNQLGDTSTVAQIISNYANTRRKWSLERNQVFDGQIVDVRRKTEERVYRRLISEAPQTIGSDKKAQVTGLKTDDDFNAAILEIGDAVREL